MNDQPFRFDHDMPNRFLRIEFNGFWTHEIIEAFKRKAGEIVQAAVKDGATPGQSRILLIARNFPVQDKDLTEEIGALMPMYSRLARRFAVVTSGSAIQRMQLKRILLPDTSKLFLDEDTARTWLLET